MSGGSFNYLCTKDFTQIIESSMSDLAEMADELDGLGHLGKPLADRTRELRERIREVEADINEQIEQLSPVWHAVEWWRSCDWSREQVFVAIGEHRERSRASRDSQHTGADQ